MSRKDNTKGKGLADIVDSVSMEKDITSTDGSKLTSGKSEPKVSFLVCRPDSLLL